MRIIKSLVAVSAVAATAAALAVAPALADPVNNSYNPVRANSWDVVGAGSATTMFVVDQLGYNYDHGLAVRHVKSTPSNPYFYSWDSVNPKKPTQTPAQVISTKKGCTGESRPAGSGAGIAALAGFGAVHYVYRGKHRVAPCVDYARSSRGRSGSDALNTSFVVLGQDAVTYALTTPGNAPHGLTLADLMGIFRCTPGFTNWSDFGGPNAAIDPIIPENASGTESFFYGVLGLPTKGETEPTCGSLVGVTKGIFEENEGVNKQFYNNNTIADGVNPNVITLFSIGSYIDQAFHSKTCGKAAHRGQNAFGCNQVGVLHLGSFNSKGTVIAPTATVRGHVVINAKFPGIWKRFLYDVVVTAKGSDPIPGYLQRFFNGYKKRAPRHWVNGFFCSPSQQTTIENYGYLAVPKACGAIVP